MNPFCYYLEDLTNAQIAALGFPACDEWRIVHDADEGHTFYSRYGIVAMVYDDQGNQSGNGQVYVPIIESAKPGSGMFWRWLDEFKAMHAPKEIVFVLAHDRFAASLDDAGYRCVIPEEAYQPEYAEQSAADARYHALSQVLA